MTPLATLIAHADIPEPVRELLPHLPWDGTVAALADHMGVTERTVYRAVAAARKLGLVADEYALTPDSERILRACCQGVGRPRETPGAEYTPLADVDAARDDRARWFYRRGSGPRWAMERGAELAREKA